MSKKFFSALLALSEKNGISQDDLLEKVKQGVEKAVAKDLPGCTNVVIILDADTETFEVKSLKNIVDKVLDDANEISLEEAKAIDEEAVMGGVCEVLLDMKRYRAVANKTAKSFIKLSGETNAQFFSALTTLSKENGITEGELLEKIRQGIEKSIKREMPDCENINVDIDAAKGRFEIKILKTIVEEVFDPSNEISLEKARLTNSNATLGEIYEIKLDPAQFGRVAAQAAKQFIKQDIKEYEKQKLIEMYDSKVAECVSATVAKVEPNTLNAVLTIENSEVYLLRTEQIPNESLVPGDIIKVYIAEIANKEKKPIIKISRVRRELVKRLFELEVPEIYDGTIEIKAISREAGSRSKLAVYSKDENVDAIGACIGPKRSRITSIVEELKGEKIDIIPWSEDDAEFIKRSLAPAEVISVEILTDSVDENMQKSCRVVVPNNQLSLAIGNKGQNAKLAARLTGYKIDIVPEVPV